MSKVEFNLLPDVKQEYIKSQKQRKLVSSVSYLVAGFSVALFVVLLVVASVIQKSQLDSANKNLNGSAQALKKTPGIENALIVKNQLQTLTGLHQSKHISSRIFTYLPKLTPSDVTITRFDMDYSTNIMNIAGTAASHGSVNSFIDNLKNASYKVGTDSASSPAFTNVVESSFGIASGSTSYSLTMQFDPQLFSNNLKDGSGKSVAPTLIVRGK